MGILENIISRKGIIKIEEFILNPVSIGGGSRGFIIPKIRMKLNKKKYIVVVMEVEI